jgi:hypothetical protein
MMRAFLVLGFLAYGFDSDDMQISSPTDDPEESKVALLDEYDGDLPAVRLLQTLVNASNITLESPTEEGTSVPWIPLALVGLGGAGAAGYFMTQQGASYETTFEYEYDEDGLLDEEYEYDEEYEEYDEEYYE